MTKLVTVVCFFLMVGLGCGMPASNDQLDKPRRLSREYVTTTRIRESSFKQNLDTLSYESTTIIVATVNDIAINTVNEDKKHELLNQLQPQLVQPIAGQQPQPSTVEISGISTGANPAPANPVAPSDSGFRPHRAGSMFARIIDDIFQIPIAVLQNVARLITNPFAQARKNAEAAQAA